MVDPSYSSQLSNEFGGAWTLPDALDVPLNKAFQSENMVFLPGSAGSRLGYSVAFNANEPMTAMKNWISQLGNLLVWYRTSDNSVQLINISSPSQVEVIAGDLLGYACIFADAGARLYAAFFSTAAVGASAAKVISYQNATFVSDSCFQPPITYVPSAPSEPLTGTITAGAHNLGYCIEYRSGFITRPSPDSGVGFPSITTFTPVVFTAAGLKNAAWTLNTAWPVGAVKVHVLMTPVANPAQYFFVPGANAAIIGGTTQSVTITFDISDDLLFADATDASAQLILMTASVAGAPRIFPSFAITHGDRMVYGALVSNNVGSQSSGLYISNKGAFQEISADESLFQIPGFKDITTVISLDGTLYIFGPQWTYRTIDNQGPPSTWPAASLVDGRRGTLSVRGAIVAPSGTYAWVASQDGLYFFQGSYSALPISYYAQPFWRRINWNVAQCLDIRDLPELKKVFVLAALDDAITPSHMLTWDYTGGFDPSQVHFSLDSIRNFNMGAFEIVKNSLSGLPTAVSQEKELWVGPSDEEPIYRNNSLSDINPYRDNEAPIRPIYETSLFPHMGTGRGEVYQHHGADYRLKGQGTVQIKTYTLDHAQVELLLDVALSPTPGEIPHRGFEMIGEGVSHLIGQGESLIVDPNFEFVNCP